MQNNELFVSNTFIHVVEHSLRGPKANLKVVSIHFPKLNYSFRYFLFTKSYLKLTRDRPRWSGIMPGISRLC